MSSSVRRRTASNNAAAATQPHQSRVASYHESPVIPDYDPYLQNAANTGQLGRSTSTHKRRSSQNSQHQQPYYDPASADAASEQMSATMNNPAQYSSQVPARTQTVRSARVPKDIPQHYSQHQQDRRVLSEPMAAQNRVPARKPMVQTTGLDHKSPLQKLEVTLDDISKEEKRARVQEAELAAQDRAHRNAPSKIPTQSKGHSRSVSVPDKMVPQPQMVQRTHRARHSSQIPHAAPRPADPYVSPVIDDPHRSRSTNRGKAPVTAIAPNHRYHDGYSGQPGPVSPIEPPIADYRRGGSKRLQKQPPQDKRSSSQYSPQIAHHSSPAGNSVHRSSSQQVAHADQNGLGISGDQIDGRPPVGQQRASYNFLHRGQADRRYQPGPVISEWKSVGTASLHADDLDLVVKPDIPPEADNRAWWEKNSSERKRSSSAPQSKGPKATYDGYFDKRSGQTYYNPSIYLKCGPLLRFRGIYKEQSRSARTPNTRNREIWKGSIMIVTVDSKSRYQQPPTLRLFKQPVDLLPPPPPEIKDDKDHHLGPEYIDPIAGQVKISRVGKTLYVRPVEDLEVHKDLSRREDDTGLFEEVRTAPVFNDPKNGHPVRQVALDGEKIGKVKEIPGAILFAERGVTFWKFNIEIELGAHQQRIAYRINRGPATGFWVPARGENMNMMFHSCNGFSVSVDPDNFSGPDPLWRDVLNAHQTRPFHAMIGGGDQVYMDAISRQTRLFKEWAEMKNPIHKRNTPFSAEMQEEAENFYLNRYAMWFSQGFFGMANSQIPMVNIWDDHDIIDGFGSYPDHTMQCPVFTGIGAIAFKYYMLFQHQSVPEETEKEEPSWLLGVHNGPFIAQRSRSVFMSMGSDIDFLGLDCRTERKRDMILSDDSWEAVFERLERDIVRGETRHLIVLLGIPMAYPRLNFLENVLTSRMMDPIKAIGRTGMLGGFVNKFDGGVEILDDLDDHWTAKHHKDERNWFVQELQHLAAQKSVRVTILGGDVHLCAVGEFFSNKKLGIAKDRDHRYMPNVISSAIVNTPPSDMLADVLNRRNKIHHLDDYTDESMIKMFNHDIDGKPRNNKTLLPRRNWCSIREYSPNDTPPSTPSEHERTPSPARSERSYDSAGEIKPKRSLSLTKRTKDFANRLKGKKAPPIAYYNNPDRAEERRRASADAILNRPDERGDGYFQANSHQRPGSANTGPHQRSYSAGKHSTTSDPTGRPNPFVRRPTDLSVKALKLDPDRDGAIDLTGGLDIRLNVENERGDPAGTTTDYRLIVPALDFSGEIPEIPEPLRKRTSGIKSLFGSFKKRPRGGSTGGDSASISGSESDPRDRDAPNPHDREHTPLQGWTDKHAPKRHEDHNSLPTNGFSTVRRSGAPLPETPHEHIPQHHSSQHQPGRTSSVRRSGAPLPDTPNELHIPRKRDHQPHQHHHSNHHRSSSQNTYPPPTTASPPKHSSHLQPYHDDRIDDRRIASDGRPTRNRFRGDLYDTEAGPQSDARDSFAYGRRDGGGRYAADERDEGAYHDPGSPTAMDKKNKRKSSWKFWKVGA